MRGIYIASTGQHVGKTTVCLGLLSGLKKRFSSVAYMKPVGQDLVAAEKRSAVDKDVALFREHFRLADADADMSPVTIPPGFTRSVLNGAVAPETLARRIRDAYESLSARHPFTLVEGTGHMGVGSILQLNNAQVAALLRLSVILITSGGLGSAFDALALNKTLCDAHGVAIKGVILNRVHPEKLEMLQTYMSRALASWRIPLLACIPFDGPLSYPSMRDFETLFGAELMTGEQHRLRHFPHIRLAAASVGVYRERIVHRQLIVTPASREDIVHATLTKHWDVKIAHPQDDLKAGLILTGHPPPSRALIEQVKRAEIPMLYTPISGYEAMKRITSFTAKIQSEDTTKVQEAIRVVESHIPFDALTRGASSL
jgi:BioD-like phosphotransacetylase family protein